MNDPECHKQYVEYIRSASRPMEPIPPGLEPRHDPLPGLRCVLFDVYGTLFISGTGDVGTVAETDDVATDLKAAIQQQHAEARARGVAYPEVDILDVWKSVLSHEPEDVRLHAIAHECRVNPVWPMPGALDLIRVLRQRGLRLGIVSNAQFYTPLLFEAFFGQTTVDLGFEEALTVWSYRLGEGKPSRRLFDAVLGPLREDGIKPDEVLYVGNDMRNDVWTASRCGCRTALFAGDRRSLRLREDDPRCARVRPDRVWTSLSSTVI
jgi:putative hydrolase of the HAD superfamily